jgi:hypothetical protein
MARKRFGLGRNGGISGDGANDSDEKLGGDGIICDK